MASYRDVVRDDSGYQRPVEGALVYLLDANQGLVAGDANPVRTNDFGVFEFTNVPDGTYTRDIRFGGVSYARDSVIVGDPPEYTGLTGPSNNTRINLAALKAANVTDKTSLYDGSLWTWTIGNFTGQADDLNIVASNGAALTVGAWVRQKSNGVSYQPPFASPAPRTVQQKLAEGAVSLPDARRVGETDAQALVKAVASGRIVHLPQGQGQGPGGSYLMSTEFEPTIAARDAIRVFSDDGAVMRMDSTAATNSREILLIDSGSNTQMIDEVWIRGVTFEDDVETLGFAEFRYLLAINGASRTHVEDCRFIGFRGDGLYVGTGILAGQMRKNKNVVVEGCYFDGINTNNRNGISIIQARGVTIRDNEFWRTTRRGGVGAFDPFDPNTGISMPGAIDLEANNFSHEWIRGAVIQRNLFRDIGAPAVRMFASTYGTKDEPDGNYIVRDNDIQACYGGVWSSAVGMPAVDSLTHAVLIENNYIAACTIPILLDGLRGATVQRNTLFGGQQPSSIGFLAGLRDLRFNDNFLFAEGSTAEYALSFQGGLLGRSEIKRNRFVGCGKVDGTGGALGLFRAGDYDGLEMEGNRAISAGRTLSGWVYDGATPPTVNRLTCTDFDNRYDFTPATQDYRPYRTDNPVPMAVGGGFGEIRIDRDSQTHFRLAGDTVTLPVTLPIAGATGKYAASGAVGGAAAPIAAGEQNVPAVHVNQSDALAKITATKWAADGTETGITGSVKLRIAASYPAAA